MFETTSFKTKQEALPSIPCSK